MRIATRNYNLGRRFSSPNDRSPDENVKRSAHDGQFPQEDISQPKGLQSPYKPAAGSPDRGRRRTARPEALGTEAPSADCTLLRNLPARP